MSEQSETTKARAHASPQRRLTLDAATRGLLHRFLQDWVWPRWRQLALTLMLTALLAAATGAYPMVIKASFDTLMDGNTGVLPIVLGAIISITAARSLLLYLQSVMSSRIVLRMTTDIQKTAFAHLVNADFARLTRDSPGHLMSRLTNDVALIQQASLAALNTAVRDSLSIVALVISMLYLDWVMSLIALSIYPLAALPIATISDRLRRVARRTQAELGEMTSLLAEKLSSARLIKTYRLETYAAEQINRSFEQVYELRVRAVKSRARLDPILEALGGLAIAGVILLAYWRIGSGLSTVGDFMGFVTALLMAAQPIRALGNLTGRVGEGLVAAENIYRDLDEKPQVADQPGAEPLRVAGGGIRFENVGFSYTGDRSISAVTGFTLDVPAGKTVALVGASGAGKSTVINLVPRLFDVTEGRILIDGQDVRNVTLASLRRAISIVSQDVTLFDDTIAANIALGRLDATKEEIEHAAKAAAAEEFILEQPHGYETEIGDRGLRLSGGQRQRVALARAILKDAPILLLDEATSALDSESERLVQQALAVFTRDRTTLVIAHRLTTVQRADLICVMDKGAIVELGTHGELMANDSAYRRLVRAQVIAEPIRATA